MTDKYDLSSIDTLPAAPTSAPSKYDLGGIDAMPAASGFDKTASLFAASIGNPSEEAERRRLESDITRITGFREPVADIREATRRRQQLEADHITRASPRTSLFLSAPENAAVAIQDAKTLAQIEAIIGGDPLRSLEIAAKRGAMSTGALGAKVGFDFPAVATDIIGESLRGVGVSDEYNVFKAMSASARRNAVATRSAIEYFTPEARNMVERAAASAGESAGMSLQLAPLAAATPQGAGMAAAFGLTTFAESYTKAREAGKGPLDSLKYAIPQGAFEGLFEMAPAAFLADAIKNAPGLKQFTLGLIGKEVPSELQTTLAQNLNDWVTFNPGKSVSDFIAEQPEALAETAIATVMGAGIQAGLIHGAQRVTGQFQVAQEERRLKQQAEVMQKLFEQAKNIKSDPVTFKSFMDGVTDNATVFVNADDLQQVLAQNGMSVDVLPTAAEMLAQGPSVTGDVEIPVGELMTAFAGTPAQEQIVQHTRVRQDDLSQAQWEQMGDIGAFLKSQTKEVQERQKQNEQFQSELDEIEASFTGQLPGVPNIATAGYGSRDQQLVGRMVRHFYAVAADRMGVSPKQVADLWSVKFPGADQATPVQAVTLGSPVKVSWTSGKYTFTETRTYEHRPDDGRISRTTTDESGTTKKEWLIVRPDGSEVWAAAAGQKDDYANVTPEDAQRIANDDMPDGAQAATGPALTQGFDHGKPMVNIGLDIGDQQNALSKEDAIAMLQKLGVTVTDSNVLNLTHEWGNENTLVAHLDKPLTPEQMTQLMADTQQEAIPQYEGGVGTLYHATPEAATKWGPFNPEYFRDLQGTSLLDAQKVLAQKKTKTPKITEIVKGQKLEQSTPLTAKQWADVRGIALETLSEDEKTAWLEAEQEVLAGVEEANRNSDVLKEIAKTALEKMPVPRVSTVPLLAGRLKLKIEPTGNFRKDGTRKTRVPDVARALFNKFRNAKASVETPEGREIMARAMTHEALYALSQDGHAVGWYDRKVREAIMTFALVHPEVLTSPRHNLAFRLIAAITSNGQAVRDNFILANDIYNLWSKDQVFPTEFAFDESQADQEVDEEETPPAEGFEGGGQRKPAMVAAFKKINVLVKELGWDAIESEMLQLRTVRDVEKEFGLKIGGENKDTVIPTAVGLGGPKIGNFFANLSGYFDSPTMDLWFMRTAGRMEGTLLETKAALVEHLDELLTLLPEGGDVKGQPVATLRKEIEKYKALDKEAQLDAETTLKTLKHVSIYARAQFSQFASPHPDTGKTYWDKSDVNVNARRLVNNLAAVREAPSSGGERNNLRAVVTRAMELLEKQGISLTAADLQAVLWYHEKNLYSKLGDISASAKPWDYASAARFSVGRELGLVDVGSRQRAEAVPAGQPAAGGAGGLGAVQGLGQEDQGGALAQAVRSSGAVAGPVVGIHYSQQPRTSLASSAFGSGMPGAERERLATATDPRIKQRVAFYVNTGSGITPESGVGPHPHAATLRNLYDADADALKIWRNSKGDMNAAESAVLDAGFDGYLTRNFGGTGAAVMLGSRNVDVQSVKREDVNTTAEQPPSPEIPRMKQAAMAILQNTKLPFGQQSVESWKRDLERTDPDTASLIDWAAIPPGDYYKDQIAARLWQDMPEVFAGEAQQRRGSFNPLSFELRLTEHANRTTLIHELSHFFMAAYIEMAQQPNAPAELTEFVENLLGYLFKTVPGGTQVGGEGLGQRTRPGNVFGREIAPLAIKAHNSLSPEARRRIEGWNVNWHVNQGKFLASPEGQEIRAAFAPVRAKLRELYGDTVPAYRGEYLGDKNAEATPDRTLFSWTPIQDLALKFAINRGRGMPRELTQEAVDKAVADYRRAGFVKFNGVTYKKADAGLDDPYFADYFLMYDSDGQVITDGTDLPDALQAERDEREEYRAKLRASGSLYSASVPVDSIFWIPVGVNLKNPEFIAEYDPRTMPSETVLFQEVGAGGTAPGPLPEGRTNLERWNAMTLDQQRPYWEHFAEQWEQYAMTGKAPTKALQTAFSAFAKWMKSVYQSFKNFLLQNPQAKPLDPEITQYFDRMLATEAELEAAREERGYKALFKAAADAGMSPSQFADYMALDELQKTEANELLLSRSLRDMKWLSNAKSKAIKEIQAEADELRALVRASVEEELADTPIRKAERWLRKGEMVQDGEQIKATAGFKLNAEIVKAMFPQGAVDSVDIAKLKQMMSSTGTQHPDDVAAIFGFRNGETMVRELLELQPFKDEASQLTDLRMLEEHGDLATPEAIEKAADAAISNNGHLKMIATELWALSGRTGSVAPLVKAAKEFAKNLIGNTVVKKLSPVQYTNASTRAGKMTERLLKKGERDAAGKEKRLQVINAAAAKEAYAAEAEVRAMMNRLRKIANYSDKHSSVTSREFSVVQAVRAILGEFEIGSKGEKAQTYVATVSEYDPMLGARLKEVIDTLTAAPKPWAELTVDELRELHAEVGSLWTLARDARTVELAGEKMTLDEARAELTAKINESRKAGRKPGSDYALTKAEIRNQEFMSTIAVGIRPETWFKMQDGLDDYGPWIRRIWNAIARPQEAYTAEKAAKIKELRALLEPIMSDLTTVEIDAWEIGYTFGKGAVPGYAELLHAIIHTGNTSNKERLLLIPRTPDVAAWGSVKQDGTLDSSKWDAFMARMFREGKITKAHMDFVQGIWDLNESMKPSAQKAHRATKGRYFPEIPATEVVTPFGTYRGGYAPAVADPRLSPTAEAQKAIDNMQQDVMSTFEQPLSGFTKERSASAVKGRPLELNIASLGRHIDSVLLFSHMAVPVRNVQRVLRGEGVLSALSEKDRDAMMKVIMPWLNSAVTQRVTETGKHSVQNWRVWSAARSRSGMSTMFGHISNALQQLTGFFPALTLIKPSELLFTAGKGFYQPKKLAASVAEMSPYMAQRLDTEAQALADEVEQIMLNPGKFEKAQDWAGRHAYFLQMAVDFGMSPIIWQAKFNEVMAEGKGRNLDADGVAALRQKAIDLADSAVRMTQGSNRAIDVAAIEKGSPLYRLFLQFAGWFNTQANLLGLKMAQERLLPGGAKRYGRNTMHMALIWWAPAIVSMIIALAMRGGPDDADGDGLLDDWLAELLMAPVKFALATVPVGGAVITAFINAFNDKPYDDRMPVAPVISVIEAGARGAAGAVKAIEDPEKAGRAIRDLGSFFSLMSGVPITPVTKAIGYATDVETGKVAPTGPVDYGRGIITGTASPESKR